MSKIYDALLARVASTERAAWQAAVDHLKQQVTALAAHVDDRTEVANRTLDDLRAALSSERATRQQSEADLRALVRNVAASEVADAAERESAATVPTMQQQIDVLRTRADELAAALRQMDGRLESVPRPPLVAVAPAQPVAAVLADASPPRARRWQPALAAAVAGMALLSAALLSRRLVGDRSRDSVPAPRAAADLPGGLADSRSAELFASGVKALQSGKFESAERAFRSVVGTSPGCVEARNNLAVALSEQQHVDAAVAQLREALRIRPDYERARLNLERLKSLRGRASGAPYTTSPNSVPVARDEAVSAALAAAHR